MKKFNTIIGVVFFLMLIINCTLKFDNCKAQWIQQPVPNNTGILLSIDFADANTGISGGWYNFYGKALYTSNGGMTWLTSTVPDSSRSFVTVKLVDSVTGFMAGAQNLFTAQNLNVSIDSLLRKGFSRSTIQHMVNIGMSSAVDYKALFVKTTDRGRNWFTYGVLPPQYTYLYGMDFVDANTGIITTSIQDTSFSGNSTLAKTTNGGFTWTEILNIDTALELNAVKFIDYNNIIAVGRGGSFDTITGSHTGGMIFKSTDGGTNWTLQFFLHEEFNDVNFSDHMTGFVSNNSQSGGKVYKTTNQGLNWNIVLTQSNTSLITGIKFNYGSGTGMIYGIYGGTNISVFTRRTANYGVNWGQMQLLDTSGQYLLYGGAMVSDYNQYLSGGSPWAQAVVYHTTNGGSVSVTSLGNSIPEKFSLSQNFPNPFNPVTNLEFGISDLGFVSLKVYDILGKEIITLVNEKLSPGNYKIEFDGSGLTSGVYFYRLTAGEFTETKRMMLIK